jgi:carbon-monoxide dehydrogenase large subunit
MSSTEPTEAPIESGGVGARVRRREDERHLHGKGRFVADYTFPDLQEVAFLRSPLAHARIEHIGKPERFPGQVIVREDMHTATDIVADSSLPTYKPSAHPPLAS